MGKIVVKRCPSCQKDLLVRVDSLPFQKASIATCPECASVFMVMLNEENTPAHRNWDFIIETVHEERRRMKSESQT